MSEAHRMIAQAATRLAADLPGPVLDTLVAALDSGKDTALKAAQALPHLHYRSLATDFVGVWQQGCDSGAHPVTERQGRKDRVHLLDAISAVEAQAAPAVRRSTDRPQAREVAGSRKLRRGAQRVQPSPPPSRK